MKIAVSFCLSLVLVLCSSAAWAERVIEVEHGQVRLGQIWDEAPSALADVAVADAPPAGSSKRVAKQELVQRLVEQGKDPKGLALPISVRIKTRSETWTLAELETASRTALDAMLKPGIEIVRIRTRGGLVLPAGSVAGTFELSKLPRRAGECTVTGILPLRHGGEVVARVPVTLVLEISPAAALPLISRGAVLQLVVSKSSAQVSALAEAMSDGDVGETIQFRVQSTRRVVQGVVRSMHKATVVQ